MLCSCNDSANGVDPDDPNPGTEQPGGHVANNTIHYTALSKITPATLESFGNAHFVSNTFEDGKGVIEFDAEITTIGYEAFIECRKLTGIVLPNSLKTIGNGAFWGCSGLTSIAIPNSVTSIGNGAFGGCGALVSFDGKFATPDKRCLVVDGVLVAFAPAELTEYDIPANVTEIGSYVFEDCNNLTSIMIPVGVVEIGEGAFDGCNLTTFYCKPTTPPTLEEFYIGLSNNVKIYVPRASVEAYKAADGWKDYASQIEGYDF